MAFGLYMPGQGKWSRGVAAIGLGAMGIWAALETYGWMSDAGLAGPTAYYFGYWLPALILATALWAIYYIANRPGTTDFIVETEAEMKKVTWPTSREVLAATGVVIVVVVILGVYMFFVDRVCIQPFFQLIGILPKSM